MFKHLLITVLLTFTVGIASAGKMVLLEEAAEFESLNVQVTTQGNGDIRLRPCDDCKEIRLTISPSTTLKVSGKPQPLSALNQYTLRSGTVFYRADDNIVTRIEAVH